MNCVFAFVSYSCPIAQGEYGQSWFANVPDWSCFLRVLCEARILGVGGGNIGHPLVLALIKRGWLFGVEFLLILGSLF